MTGGQCDDTTKASVAFNTASDYWLDIEEFESLTRPLPNQTSADRVDRLRQAVALCRGDLLKDVYDDWCAFERGWLQKLLLGILNELMKHCAGSGQHDEAIRWGEMLLKHDPTQEDVHGWPFRRKRTTMRLPERSRHGTTF